MEIACDVLLGAAALSFLGGLGLTAWSFVGEFRPLALIAGVTLIALGPVLLLVWERVAWSGFAERLSQLS